MEQDRDGTMARAVYTCRLAMHSADREQPGNREGWKIGKRISSGWLVRL